MLVGCLPAPTSDGPDSGGGASWPLQILSDRPAQAHTGSQFIESEPNDTFDNAGVLDNDAAVEIRGTISTGKSPTDMDICRLRGGNAGDRVQASLTIHNGNDLVLGLLDDQLRLLAYADPASVVNGPRVVDIVLHEATSELIALVAARSASGTDRSYTARIEMIWGAGVLGYQPQTIVLNFDGATSVKIGRRSPVYVPPFDAAVIDGRLAGQTQTLRDLVVQLVREDYAGLDVAVYASGDPGIPPGGVTTVHFGTYDAGLLGLADSIDPYNAQSDQNAIIYTDTFSLFGVLNPSVTEYAQVLANVASHEAGHLLGLRHTVDVHDLMDITATARQMLFDQWFRTAALHASVLPAGYQDSPALLAWALGGSLIPPSTGKIVNLQRHAAVLNDPTDFHIPRGWLGTCGLESDTP